MKVKTIEQQINEACAVLCGRVPTIVCEEVWGEDKEFTLWCKHGEDEECSIDDDPTLQPDKHCWLPDFYNNRNAIPELLEAVRRIGREWDRDLWRSDLVEELGLVHIPPMYPCQPAVDIAWKALELEPSDIAAAALRATGNWKAEWSE